MSTSCALARAKLARHVETARQASAGEKVTTAAKAGFVGSVVTPLRAVVGNATWGGMRSLVLQPTEAGFDYMMAVGKAARGGFKVSPAEFREVTHALDAAGIRAMGRAFAEGLAPVREAAAAVGGLRPGTDFGPRLRGFVQELGARLEADQVRGRPVARVLDGVEPVTYESPFVQTLVDGAYAAVEAVDRPFWRLAFEGSLYGQAKVYAMRQGLRGAARTAEVDRLLAAPTEEMLLRATDDAQFATFKDRGTLSNVATGAKTAVKRAAQAAPEPDAPPYVQAAQRAKQRGAQVADVVLELNVPFTGVPSAVASRTTGMTPLGLLSLVTDQTQAQRARTLAHVSVGGAGIWLGMELYRDGVITGPTPTDAADRAAWRAAGITPYSVKVGDTWVGLASLGPVAAPLFMGASAAAFAEREPDAGAGDRLAAAAGSTGKYLTEQTYLSNVRRVVEALGDEDKAGALLASQVPTPALFGQVERALDPYQRQPRTLLERVADRIPGGNALLPRAVGPLGELPEKAPRERVASLLSPFPLSADRDTPELRELRRLGVPLGMPTRTTLLGGTRTAIPDDQYRAMLQAGGSEVLAEIAALLRDPGYLALPDAEKADELRAVLEGARTAARAETRDSLFGRARQRGAEKPRPRGLLDAARTPAGVP